MTRDALRVFAVLAIGALSLSCGSGDDSADPDDGGDSTDTAIEGNSIEAASVEAEVAANLTDLGIAPDRVGCPSALVPEPGETTRCEVELEGLTFGVTVEIASSDGEQAVLNVMVDDQPS